MRIIKILSINVFIVLLLLILTEGVASYSILIYNIKKDIQVAERLHTTYDPELGWINIPNIYISDLYGPGIFLKINDQGFRNTHNFDTLVPSGKKRIVCSGNSFTIGYGVDNDHTWVNTLTSIDTSIETVNMGQGGYGIDQAYLLFKREFDKLEFDVHIFAFITYDIGRMESNNFNGYGKPILNLENGDLKIENVPVPKIIYRFPFLLSGSNYIKKLQTLSVINLFKQKIKSMSATTTNVKSNSRFIKTEKILYEIIKDLNEINKSKKSKLILVHLPIQNDFRHYPSKWIESFEKASEDIEVPYVNILDKVLLLPQKEIERFYIKDTQMKYPGAGGHLTNYGNNVIAEMIYKELKVLFNKYDI